MTVLHIRQLKRLTIQLRPQYHEQFEFQLDHHQEQPKSLNFPDLVSVFHQWDQLATHLGGISR